MAIVATNLNGDTGVNSVDLKKQANNLKYQINSCNNQINSLKKSLTQANSLVDSLKTEITQLLSVQDNLKKYFIINGKTVDNGKIENIKEKIQQVQKKITSTIIPEINNEITNQTRKRNSYQALLNDIRRLNPGLDI